MKVSASSASAKGSMLTIGGANNNLFKKGLANKCETGILNSARGKKSPRVNDSPPEENQPRKSVQGPVVGRKSLSTLSSVTKVQPKNPKLK